VWMTMRLHAQQEQYTCNVLHVMYYM
jgi:hypothetical protein